MNSLAVCSTDGDRAADQIMDALQHGDPELIITPQAQLLAKLHGLVPGILTDAFMLMNKLLPEPGGIGLNRALGKESVGPNFPSNLTAWADAAASRNNEL